jgi:tryptophan synthase beta chain
MGTGMPETALYPDLEKLLLEQLQQRPDDARLRVQLLELYFQTNRERDFLREARAFRDQLRGNLESTDWHLIASIGRQLAPDSPLFADFRGKTAEDKPSRRRLGEGSEFRPLFARLAKAYDDVRGDTGFLAELDRELIRHFGRPSSLYHAKRLSAHVGGAQIYCKREDLAPEGTALVMAITGQALLARRLGMRTLVTASVYGQKGAIMASVAARLGMQAVVYMDGDDAHREAANVFRIWLMGAQLEAVDVKSVPYGDVRQAALRHWLRENEDCFLIMGLDAAPYPYPVMAQEFAAVVGRETALQVRSLAKRQPDLLVARGENAPDAIGFFQPFLRDTRSRLVCVSPSEPPLPPDLGTGTSEEALSQAQIELAHAVMEGTEYPSVRREHSLLRASGRVEYVSTRSETAKRALSDFSRLEGIVPAIRTAHALGWACDAASKMPPDHAVVVAMTERADKDIWNIGRMLGMSI